MEWSFYSHKKTIVPAYLPIKSNGITKLHQWMHNYKYMNSSIPTYCKLYNFLPDLDQWGITPCSPSYHYLATCHFRTGPPDVQCHKKRCKAAMVMVATHNSWCECNSSARHTLFCILLGDGVYIYTFIYIYIDIYTYHTYIHTTYIYTYKPTVPKGSVTHLTMVMGRLPSNWHGFFISKFSALPVKNKSSRIIRTLSQNICPRKKVQPKWKHTFGKLDYTYVFF